MSEVERIKERYIRRAALPTGRYSYFNPGNLFLVHERERAVLAMLQQHRLVPLADRTILDVGCGEGRWLLDLLRWGARPDRLVGVELLGDRARAASHLHPRFRIINGNGDSLPFHDRQFDIVLQATVFTSVLDDTMRRRIAAEMLRVLHDDGVVLWYDFRYDNPRNPDVRGIGRRLIGDLFPNCRVRLRSLTLVPPVARVLASYAWELCVILERIPLLRTHYLGVIQKC